jgi:phage-related protein
MLRSTAGKDKTNTIVLDSDTLSAYNEMSSQDHNVIAPTFPVLKPGENVISWDENVVSVEIVPRWWCL